MAFEFAPLQSSEESDLIQFLIKSFGADPNLNSFRPEVIHWKYFAGHSEWAGSRSFVVKRDGQIVSHGGVWPLRIAMPKAEVKLIHLIDWAASRSAVGAGVQLLRKVAGLADVLITIGGSADTRNLLPKLGYRRVGELWQYAMVVRPWLQFRTTPQKNWKTPVKFLRDFARSGLPKVPNGWKATKVSQFSGTTITAPNTTNYLSPARTATGLDHLLRCPAARFSGFEVSDSQRLRGYFVLAQVGRQMRIADLRIDADDRASWQAMCALASFWAAQHPEVCEIVAASSIDSMKDAWSQAGFIHRRTEPIFCYDPHNLLGSDPALNLNLADGDQCFLNDPEFPYLS